MEVGGRTRVDLAIKTSCKRLIIILYISLPGWPELSRLITTMITLSSV